MKQLCLLLLLLCSTSVFSQKSGVVKDGNRLKSEILNEERKYSVYLPPCYEESERDYPVLYLLHPAGPRGTVPNQQSWINYGMLKQYMDKAIENGEIVPFIIVTPDANFGKTRISYFNDPEGDFNFEDYFIKEFIPYIEKTYRCRTERGSRVIAGASMGGGAAAFYALHYPELFAASCPLSGAIRAYDKKYLETRYPGVKEDVLKKWYKDYNVFELFEQIPQEKKSDIKWFITCGDDDALSVNNTELHILLKKLNIPHEFRMSDGKHDWTYWRSVLSDMLIFVSDNFKK